MSSSNEELSNVLKRIASKKTSIKPDVSSYKTKFLALQEEYNNKCLQLKNETLVAFIKEKMIVLLKRYDEGKLKFGERTMYFTDAGFEDKSLKFADLLNLLGQNSELSLFFDSVVGNENGIEIICPVTISNQMIIPKPEKGYDNKTLTSELVSLSLCKEGEDLVFQFNVDL